ERRDKERAQAAIAPAEAARFTEALRGLLVAPVLVGGHSVQKYRSGQRFIEFPGGAVGRIEALPPLYGVAAGLRGEGEFAEQSPRVCRRRTICCLGGLAQLLHRVCGVAGSRVGPAGDGGGFHAE